MTDTETTHHRICPLCEACCGLEIKVQAGKVISIRGHDADVFSAGYICPKGVALKDLHEDPDRLRTPLIKRNGVFEPATWDEAFAEIERRLPPIMAAHGRNATAVVVGNPSAHKIGLLTYFGKLARALGTRNVFSASTLDQMPKQLSSGLMFGHWLSVALPDIARTDYLLVLGANPLVSNGSMWTVPDFRGKAKALQARGGKLVVIDPRRTETAAVADAHHFIRPNADVFLLAAMVHTLFAEGLVTAGQRGRLGQRRGRGATGRGALHARGGGRALRHRAETIRTLTRELAGAPRAAVYARIGTCTQEYGTLASWLVDVLNTLTGNLDQEGGVLFAKSAAFASNTAGKPGIGKGVTTGRHHARVSGAPEVYGELPITCLAEEIETPGEGQIRALFTVATNPVLSSPNGPRLAKALDTLDFMVSMDIYLNETTRHADVILPGRSPLEDFHYDVAFPQLSWRNHARYSPPVLPRRAGQPEEWQTLLKLAAIVQGKGAEHGRQRAGRRPVRRGCAAPVWRARRRRHRATQGLKGPQRTLEVALAQRPLWRPVRPQARRPDAGQGHGVQRQRAALTWARCSRASPKCCARPAARWSWRHPACYTICSAPPQDLRGLAPDLVIIGRRDVRTNNSWMHNLPVLAKGPFRCTALVHPLDAARLGLARRRHGPHPPTARAAWRRQVHISDEMMPGVVSLPHGWGHDLPGAQLRVAAERPGANLNALLDDQLRDPLSGNAVLGGVAITMQALA